MLGRCLLLALTVTVSACASDTGATPSATPSDTRGKLAAARPGYEASDVSDYHRRANDVMVACMKQNGLEFIPYIPAGEPKLSLGLSDEAFARQYGFGLSTLIDYQATGTSRIDPNVRIAQSLSVGARRVYSREKAACAERVRAEVGDPPGVMRGPLEEGEEITAVSDRANADPRIAAARDAYSRCIAEKGYRGSTGEDLSSRFFEDTVPYRTAYESHVATLVQAGKDSSGVRLDSVLTGEQRVRLRQIQQAEIKAAVADWECGKVLYPVVTEVHQEYMDRYLTGEK
ncbi:hypothetical protein Sar04_03820 [Salinispora arenicola]|uniref:Lipoprotein n=2 Tax=Salinispora arenicola TaxID=168697 RepID=A0A542XIJ8_SALAC|nr:hypothetical protein FB564_0700 [Salinispora arenicola]GIM81761.1 hypothetical protein Sar04_03820 [Salinispora arenicola]